MLRGRSGGKMAAEICARSAKPSAIIPPSDQPRSSCQGSLHQTDFRASQKHRHIAASASEAKRARKLDSIPYQAGDVDMPPSPLIQLCNLTRNTFKQNPHPSAAEIEAIVTLLGSIPLSDLGIKVPEVESINETPKWAPPITYLHIHETKDFSIGIFCLPKGASIPLHNHPGMTVFSRLLYGKMHVRSFDIATDDESAPVRPPGQFLASIDDDIVLTPESPPDVLYPCSGGNIHAFTAITDCAVLDVLSPPYSPAEGRDCTYYKELRRYGSSLNQESTSSSDRYLLEEAEPPIDFVVTRGSYFGLRVELCADSFYSPQLATKQNEADLSDAQGRIESETSEDTPNFHNLKIDAT